MALQKAPYHHLRDTWTAKQASLHSRIWEKHKDALDWVHKKTQHAAAGSIGAMMLFALPGKQDFPLPKIFAANISQDIGKDLDKTVFAVSDFAKVLPETVEPLTPEQEKYVSEIFSRYYGVQAHAQLDGKRLNRSYGYIGAEQHLMRFPQDTMEEHFDNPDDAQTYYSSGMAPGRGAWGYFGTDEQATQREKYYIAVQTFLSPGWGENTRELYQYFKFRKMLVVNPENGKAVVAVIGDAGPAPWTGKHLGGSPEVMKHLERVDGKRKGPVLYFFLDDPKDTIPLGPISVVQ